MNTVPLAPIKPETRNLTFRVRPLVSIGNSTTAKNAMRAITTNEISPAMSLRGNTT